MSDASQITTNPTPIKLQDATTTPSPNSNIFDPAKLRLSQDFDAMVGVKKALLTVPVRRPDRQWYLRVHPDESWRLPTAVLEDRTDRETYLVDPSLFGELPGDIVAKVLFTAINRQGVVFLWPVKLPGTDGRLDEWSRSAMEAAGLAMKDWVKVVSNQALGAYEVIPASAQFPEPEWPDIGFGKILEIAFRDKFIRTVDHPVLRRLRGEL
jgi:hypothetical protein